MEPASALILRPVPQLKQINGTTHTEISSETISTICQVPARVDELGMAACASLECSIPVPIFPLLMIEMKANTLPWAVKSNYHTAQTLVVGNEDKTMVRQHLYNKDSPNMCATQYPRYYLSPVYLISHFATTKPLSQHVRIKRWV